LLKKFKYTRKTVLPKDLKFQLDTDQKSNFVELIKIIM